MAGTTSCSVRQTQPAVLIKNSSFFFKSEASDRGGFSSRDTHRNPTTQRKHLPSCPFCSLEDYAFSCPKYREATPKQRFNFVKNHNLCINCLGKDHMKSSCPSKNRCSKRDVHSITLHFMKPLTNHMPDLSLTRYQAETTSMLLVEQNSTNNNHFDRHQLMPQLARRHSSTPLP